MKKTKMKAFVFAMLFLFSAVVEFYPMTQNQADIVEAASVVKLSKKNINLVKGKTAKLRLKAASGKIQWKSSNKSVVTVSKNGIVKAKKKGTAQICAKYNGKSYKCTVNVTNKKKQTSGQGKTTLNNTQSKAGLISIKTSTAAVDKGESVASKTEDKTADEPLKMVIDGETTIPLSRSSIPFSFKNTTNETLSISNGYNLYQKINNEWVYVDYIGVCFTCEMVELLPGEVYTGDVILEDGVKKCQAGEYRVCKNVGGYAMYADFVIEDMDIDVEMKLQGENVIPASQQSIIITLTNNTAEDIETISLYDLDIKKDGKWVPYNFSLETMNNIYCVKAGETVQYEFKKYDGKYELVPGEYRFFKFVCGKEFYVDFTVVE